MKKILLKTVICLLAFASIVVATAVLAVPCLPASWLWRSGFPEWQELAIPTLMNQIRVGMNPEEVARLFGVSKPPPSPYMGGSELQSFNVNSWYNRGIDVVYTNGFVREAREYD